MDEDRLLDEIAAAATPAQADVWIDGWWCKASPDLPFRRASAVLPAATAGEDPERDRATLAAVRADRRARGLRLLIQVADPAHQRLDAVLAAEGLEVEAPVEVLVAEEAAVHRLAARARPGARPSPVSGPASPHVRVTAGVDPRWSDQHGTLAGTDERARARTLGYGRMLEGLGDRAVGASATIDEAVVGVGYAVVDRGWVGAFGMATASAHRRRGVGRAVLAALVAAGHDRGARRAYLQVEADNVAAAALYAGLGFARHHRYHYRSEPEPPLRTAGPIDPELC